MTSFDTSAEATVRFEEAQPEDVERLLDFMRGLYAHDGLPLNQAEARRALRELLLHPEYGRVWLLCLDDEAVGYLALTLGYSLEYHGRDAFVDELYIEEPFRGRGLGRRAIEFAADECRRLGVGALHLEVERSNATAQAVYRRSGFVDHDRYLLTRLIS